MSTGNKIKAIGTHSGTFHCDEALACYMLKLLPEFKAAEVVRSRDPKVLEELPVLVDVGGVYDAGKHRYDHHQRGFNEVFGRGFNVKLSSAGLVYKHFGKRIISQVTGITDEKKIDVLFLKVYDGFIQALDGIDNGVEMIDGGGPKKYRISTDLSSRVKYLNPAWNEDNSDIQERFERAMALTGSEFKACLSRYTKSWLPAREVVQKAILDRKNVHSSGSIVLLEAYCSWQSHLFDLEQELKLLKGSEPPTLLYVLYPDSSGKWRIQCVPECEGSFISRLPLPESWRGLRGEELSKKSKIPGCVFAHANGFMGGNATKEGVLAMATESIAMGSEKKPAKRARLTES